MKLDDNGYVYSSNDEAHTLDASKGFVGWLLMILNRPYMNLDIRVQLRRTILKSLGLRNTNWVDVPPDLSDRFIRLRSLIQQQIGDRRLRATALVLLGEIIRSYRRNERIVEADRQIDSLCKEFSSIISTIDLNEKV